MKKTIKTLILFLFPKLKEILYVRDRLHKENIELRERVESLDNSQNELREKAVIKSGNYPNFSDFDADFSVKIFDSKKIPGKN